MTKTNKNLDDMHIIYPDKTNENSQRIETIYTMIGTQDHLESDYPCLSLTSAQAEESADAYAMKIQIGKRTKYYAKTGRHGRLFNPIGMYSEGTAAKKLGHAGRLEWRFIEIGERVFYFYRDFLKTRNLAYLNNAERELL